MSKLKLSSYYNTLYGSTTGYSFTKHELISKILERKYISIPSFYVFIDCPMIPRLSRIRHLDGKVTPNMYEAYNHIHKRQIRLVPGVEELEKLNTQQLRLILWSLRLPQNCILNVNSVTDAIEFMSIYYPRINKYLQKRRVMVIISGNIIPEDLAKIIIQYLV